MELINGKLDECKAMVSEALLQVKALVMKIPSLLIAVEADMAGHFSL
jgi:hypothetical protein